MATMCAASNARFCRINLFHSSTITSSSSSLQQTFCNDRPANKCSHDYTKQKQIALRSFSEWIIIIITIKKFIITFRYFFASHNKIRRRNHRMDPVHLTWLAAERARSSARLLAPSIYVCKFATIILFFVHSSGSSLRIVFGVRLSSGKAKRKIYVRSTVPTIKMII